MTSLTSASLRGAVILNGLSFVQLGLRLVGFVWLARLLGPEDFGLAAIAITIVLMAGALNDAGMSSALVRRAWPARTMTLTVFWSQVIIGLALAGLVLLAAPLLGWIFGRADAVPLIRLAACALVANGIAAVPWTLMQRDGQFMGIARADLISSVLALGLAIIVAQNGMGPYAALTLFVAPTILRAALLWISCGLALEWRFSRRALGSILPYSLNLLGEQLVSMISQQLDRSIIGIRLGAPPLGTYHQAGQIFVMPLQLLSWGANSALFPLFAKLRDDPAQLARSYLFATRAFVALAFPVYVGIIFVADPAIRAMLGAEASVRWVLIAPTLSILCLAGLAISLGSFNGILLQALGFARTLFRFSLLTLGVLAICLLVGVNWGLLGAAAGFALATALATAALTAQVMRLAGIAPGQWVRAIRGPVLATVTMSIVLFAATPIRGMSPGWDLAMLIPLGMLSYALAILVFDRDLCQKVWRLRRGHEVSS